MLTAVAIDQVPAAALIAVSSTTPEAIAADTTSKNPPNTGVPAARPNSSAAFAVILPHSSEDPTIGAVLDSHSSTPNNDISLGSYCPV